MNLHQEAHLPQLGALVQCCLLNTGKLSKWAKDNGVEVADYQKSWKVRYHHSMKGIVLIVVSINLKLFIQ